MIDDDHITSRLDGESGGQQIAFAGGNSLVNEARITTYGASEYKDMNDAQHALVQSLQAGQTILTPNGDWMLAGSATGTLKVLFINGDCYDLNLISQTNILSDQDQVAQWTGSGGGAVQGAVTGANSVYNTAHIIDVGTLTGSAYIGGDVYEDSILIQANLVIEDDQVAIHTEAYVPEVIAFTGDIQTAPDDCAVSQPTKVCDPAHYDNLGNVLM